MKKILFIALLAVIMLSSCGRAIVPAAIIAPVQAASSGSGKTSASAPTPAPAAQSAPKPESKPEPQPVSIKPEPQYELELAYSKRYDHYGMRQRDMYIFTNTGTENLYLDIKSFDFETADGHLVDISTLPEITPKIVQPGEHSYIFADLNLKDKDLDVELVSKLSLDVEPARIECVRYEVSDITLSIGQYSDKVEALGRVKNTGDEATDSFYFVDIVAFDENDMPLDVIDAMLNEDIQPGDSMSFRATTMYYFITSLDQIARYEVYAYPFDYQL